MSTIPDGASLLESQGRRHGGPRSTAAGDTRATGTRSGGRCRDAPVGGFVRRLRPERTPALIESPNAAQEQRAAAQSAERRVLKSARKG